MSCKTYDDEANLQCGRRKTVIQQRHVSQCASEAVIDSKGIEDSIVHRRRVCHHKRNDRSKRLRALKSMRDATARIQRVGERPLIVSSLSQTSVRVDMGIRGTSKAEERHNIVIEAIFFEIAEHGKDTIDGPCLLCTYPCRCVRVSKISEIISFGTLWAFG